MASLTLGMAALGWAYLAYPSNAAFSLDGFSARILAGEQFSQDELDRRIAQFNVTDMSALPRARLQRAGAILQLRALEMAMNDADLSRLDAKMTDLSASLRAVAARGPADALLWTVMYWLESLRNGPSEQIQGYLDFSYDIGPLEGYVALRRNRMALAAIDISPRRTQERIGKEFGAMVDARFLAAAASNISGPGWSIRDRLVANLVGVDPAAKEAFARMLYKGGLQLNVPGVQDIGERPWR